MPSLDRNGVFSFDPLPGANQTTRPTEIDPAGFENYVWPVGTFKTSAGSAEDTLAVRFAGHADGRGFSVARALRADGFTGTLIATGHLIPDQARLAFQSGFDLIEVDETDFRRHGLEAWQAAVDVAVTRIYTARPYAPAQSAAQPVAQSVVQTAEKPLAKPLKTGHKMPEQKTTGNSDTYGEAPCGETPYGGNTRGNATAASKSIWEARRNT